MATVHRRPAVLTAAFVRTINRPGRYGDGRGGHGLSLLVKPTVNGRWSKTWSQRVEVGGRLTNVGLGSYPVITLAEARVRALESARAVAAGKDPRTGDAPTVAEAWEEVIRLRSPSWRDGGKSESQWRDEARRLGDDAGLIFAALRTGKPLSDNTLGKALRTAEISATIHGMRASLRDWLAAEGVPYELAEAVLAHQPRGIAKSYRRNDLLEARRPIMERWARHVDA